MSSYHIAAGQKSRDGFGGRFHEARTFHITVGATDNFIISSKPDGEGEFSVDDVMRINITNIKDSTKRVWWVHDFSGGNSGKITPLPPTNLNGLKHKERDQLSGKFQEMLDDLRGQVVNVEVELSDRGGVQGSTEIYLTLRP